MLWGSLGLAIIFLFLGDILEGILSGLDEFFNPLLLFGTLSVVGGSGVIFTKYTSLNALYVLLISLVIGLCAYFLLYYFLVIPMSQAESSTSISIKDLEGKMGEVITTVPAEGMGEVFIQSPNGNRSKTAKSFESTEIKQGMKVVVVHVEDQIVCVSKLEEAFNEGRSTWI